MVKFILSLIVLLIPFTYGFADEKADRERKVRIAIALSGKPASAVTKPAVNPFVAPFPREAKPQEKLPYFDGYAKAHLESLPLVIFIGCDREYKTDSAILAKVEAFGSYANPSILIGYPQGNRLYIDKQLESKATNKELETAIINVSKKMVENPVKQMQSAPQPLNWQINAGQQKCTTCVNCNCPNGVCPSCPKSNPTTPIYVPASNYQTCSLTRR